MARFGVRCAAPASSRVGHGGGDQFTVAVVSGREVMLNAGELYVTALLDSSPPIVSDAGAVFTSSVVNCT